MLTALTFIALATQLNDNALLDDLQHRAVNFFWNESNPENGFSKDRAANNKNTDDHTVASCASVGFALSAYVIGTERKWLARKDALERTRVTLHGLNTQWPQEHGWLYHFVDWKTGQIMWNCEASSIDTSICLGGVIVAKQYWHDPEVSREAEAFIKRIDWKWMLTNGGEKPDSVFLNMGWRNGNFLNSYWDTFDELKMIYVQAYGYSDITNKGWDQVNRQFFNYKGINVISGGPLFMHEMSESFYSFKGLRDGLGIDYAVETHNAALANRQYCIDDPKSFKAYGPNFWGLSACDTPTGYNALGAPGWINDDGTITPTSAVAAMPFTPKESLAFAESMRRDHPEAWGRYGFPNGYNPNANDWVDSDVIGIDLGMMLLGVENYRTGLPNRLSMSDPQIRRGYERAGLKPEKPGEPEALQIR